jgi:hypothetical protein
MQTSEQRQLSAKGNQSDARHPSREVLPAGVLYSDIDWLIGSLANETELEAMAAIPDSDPDDG